MGWLAHKCICMGSGKLALLRVWHMHDAQVGVQVPLIVRLEGTNVEKGKEILKNSDVKIIAADDLDDAATKAVKSIA